MLIKSRRHRIEVFGDFKTGIYHILSVRVESPKLSRLPKWQNGKTGKVKDMKAYELFVKVIVTG